MRALEQSLFYSVLWLMIATGTALYGQQPVAGILDVNGSWQLNAHEALVTAGQKLYAGDKLSTAQYNYANTITIVHFNDASRTRIACENSPKNPCQTPYVVSTPNATAGPGTSLIKEALALLLGTPPAVLTHDSVTMSRGKYVVAIREDVVNLDPGKGISLDGRIPIFPAGSYTVEAAGADGSRKAMTTQVSVDGSGAWQSLLPMPAPGLYEINVKNANGDLRADLLILLVSAPQYDSARQAFDAVKSQADSWQGVNAQSDEDTLLRAVLFSMSKST
jgi:hypothetical protein